VRERERARARERERERERMCVCTTSRHVQPSQLSQCAVVCECVSETETQTEIERVRHREGDPSKWKSAFGCRLRVKGEIILHEIIPRKALIDAKSFDATRKALRSRGPIYLRL